jgi:hypothetical protein
VKYTIFYSWQSDLPNNKNRSFIEKCIERAIKTTGNSTEFEPYFDYDRDTKNTTGSPDICETIFSKIDKSDLFIGDISIVNNDYAGRKSPNPNVLLELGYAAKKLGWSKIICFYNLEFGDINDLPFDLSHKRIFTYDSRRTDEESRVSKGLVKAIRQIYAKGMLFHPLRDHLKGKIDYCILDILKQLCCLVFGSITMTESLGQVNEFLNHDRQKLQDVLSRQTNVLGFFVHRNFESTRCTLQELFSTVVASNVYSDEWAIVVLDLIDWIRQYHFLMSSRSKTRIFTIIGQPDAAFDVVVGERLNAKNSRDSYLLLEKMEDGNRKVLNAGTMARIDRELLLSSYHINEKAIEVFMNCILKMSAIANKWLDENGNEFILDPDYYHIT